jgi:hypothetical protein
MDKGLIIPVSSQSSPTFNLLIWQLRKRNKGSMIHRKEYIHIESLKNQKDRLIKPKIISHGTNQK